MSSEQVSARNMRGDWVVGILCNVLDEAIGLVPKVSKHNIGKDECRGSSQIVFYSTESWKLFFSHFDWYVHERKT